MAFYLLFMSGVNNKWFVTRHFFWVQNKVRFVDTRTSFQVKTKSGLLLAIHIRLEKYSKASRNVIISWYSKVYGHAHAWA